MFSSNQNLMQDEALCCLHAQFTVCCSEPTVPHVGFNLTAEGLQKNIFVWCNVCQAACWVHLDLWTGLKTRFWCTVHMKAIWQKLSTVDNELMTSFSFIAACLLWQTQPFCRSKWTKAWKETCRSQKGGIELWFGQSKPRVKLPKICQNVLSLARTAFLNPVPGGTQTLHFLTLLASTPKSTHQLINLLTLTVPTSGLTSLCLP